MLKTIEEGNKAWGTFIDTILHEPTEAELAQFIPEVPDEDRDKVTIEKLNEMTLERYQAQQKADLIWLLIKETAYARRNEQHVMSKLFTKAEVENLSPETVSKLKDRFAELNAVVKGNPQ